MASRETVHNAHAKFWGDIMVCYGIFCSGQLLTNYSSSGSVYFIRHLKKFKMPSQVLVIERAVPLADVTIYNALFHFLEMFLKFYLHNYLAIYMHWVATDHTCKSFSRLEKQFVSYGDVI